MQNTLKNILYLLITATCILTHEAKAQVPLVGDTLITRDTVVIKTQLIEYETVVLRDTVYKLQDYRQIALKTNLLYDIALQTNIEVEFILGDRWSLGVEYIGSWWSSNPRNYTQQMRMGNLSLTYWLGNRKKWEKLTGWNIGLFGGYGDYDMQPLQSKGWQGKLINTGINIGYAHAISRNGRWHLHYQLGAGMMQTDYKRYYKMWDTKFGDVKVFEYPWEVRRFRWIGPTQAEISLVWMINCGTR